MTALFIRLTGHFDPSSYYVVETADGTYRVPKMAGGWQYRRPTSVCARDYLTGGSVRQLLDWLGVPIPSPEDSQCPTPQPTPNDVILTPR
jgi:hypothetical protein